MPSCTTKLDAQLQQLPMWMITGSDHQEFLLLNVLFSAISGSARLLAATTLRNVLGTKNLGDILSERESIASEMQELMHEATDPWGVTVERVEVKDVRVPEQLMRAMAAEAEAAREARAKVIAAEGEHKASRALRQAAEVIMDSPAALQVIEIIILSI